MALQPHVNPCTMHGTCSNPPGLPHLKWPVSGYGVFADDLLLSSNLCWCLIQLCPGCCTAKVTHHPGAIRQHQHILSLQVPAKRAGCCGRLGVGAGTGRSRSQGMGLQQRATTKSHTTQVPAGRIDTFSAFRSLGKSTGTASVSRGGRHMQKNISGHMGFQERLSNNDKTANTTLLHAASAAILNALLT